MKQGELKFRVWNVNSETFVDQFEARIYIWGYVECDDGKEWIEPSKGSIVIEQFTGLKDKNGKDIYEGDIISHLRHKETSNWASPMVHRSDMAEVVTFAGGCFVLESTGEKVVDYIWNIVHHRVEAEVIGNIHENAGLLAVAP